MNQGKFMRILGGAVLASLLPNLVFAQQKSKSQNINLEKVITVEEHFVLPEVAAEEMKYLTKQNAGVPPVSDAQRELMKIVLPDNDIQDVGEKRLAFMDEAGVTIQVLSYGANSPQNITDITLANELCRKANDELLRLISLNPNRFAGFAVLPMASAEKAVAELERTTRLGLKGAMISGTFNGVFFDEPQFFPVFAKAQELGVPIFMHPAVIERDISQYYYQSEQWSAVAGLMFASAGFGWHADSGIALIRLIMSGLFDKLPNLQIISGHWGELVPFYLNRLDDQQLKTLSLKKSFTQYFKENIYITPSGFFNENQLKYAIAEIGADRIVYSGDYPFLKDKNTRRFLQNADISVSDKKKIAYQNIEKLLKLTK